MYNDITLNGNKSGKTSVIIAGIHGNEKCGIEAFEKILPHLTIDAGTIHFLYGNPKAIEQNVRFVEQNLNRLFREDEKLSQEQRESYEYEQMKRIQKYLDGADALLDIHASNTQESRPFIIAENNSREITDQLPFETLVSGFDELEPGGTDGYMNSIGRIGICIECGYAKDPQSTEIAINSIYSFLESLGHIQATNVGKDILKKTRYQMETLYHTKTNSFRLERAFDDFEFLTQGEIIGYDGDEIVRAEKDGVILFARDRDTVGAEGFLWGIEKIDH